MALHRGGLAHDLRVQVRAIEIDMKAAKQHAPHRHLVHQRIEPAGEQQLIVRRLASDVHSLNCGHLLRVGDHRRQRQRGLLKSAGLGGADAAHADVGAMLEVFPVVVHCGCARGMRCTPHGFCYPPLWHLSV
jgi:hypothetical protein